MEFYNYPTSTIEVALLEVHLILYFRYGHIPLLLSQLPDNAEMTKQIFAAKLLRDTDLCAKHGSLYG